MIVSVMVMTDDGKHFAVSRESFDERAGYHWSQLHRSYKTARRRLATEIKKLEEQEEKQCKKQSK